MQTLTNVETSPAQNTGVKKSEFSALKTSSLADKEFEFVPPQLRIDDWDLDVLNENNSTILIDSVDYKGQLSSIIRNPAVPLLVLTGKLYQELLYMTQLHKNMEWGVFLTLKKVSDMRPHFLAFDWFMPGQSATAGTVTMQAKSAEKYYEYLNENYPYYKENGLHKFLCHLHSHHSMSLTNFSSVDDDQQFRRDDLGFMDDYRFYVVVTTSTIKASLVVYSPVLTRVNAAVAVTYSRPEYVDYLTKDRKKEIEEHMKKFMLRPTYASTTIFGQQSSGSQWWQSKAKDAAFGSFGTAAVSGVRKTAATTATTKLDAARTPWEGGDEWKSWPVNSSDKIPSHTEVEDMFMFFDWMFEAIEYLAKDLDLTQLDGTIALFEKRLGTKFDDGRRIDISAIHNYIGTSRMSPEDLYGFFEEVCAFYSMSQYSDMLEGYVDDNPPVHISRSLANVLMHAGELTDEKIIEELVAELDQITTDVPFSDNPLE